MSNRRIAISVGLLIGSSIIDKFTAGEADKSSLPFGVLLMVGSGVAVVGIGILMYRVLKAVNRKLAFWYPVFRILELAVTIVSSLYLLSQLKVIPNHMLYLYIPTGIGGLIFTYLLYTSKIVPRPIAVLGLIGYAALLLGVPLDLLGVLDMSKGLGLLLLAPGGLFEFLFLPIWLIVKGFNRIELKTSWQ
jgi:hypothetical protein